MIRKLEK